jgi:Tfp pilus assembly protein PilV
MYGFEKDYRGFSIVEVLIAGLILVFFGFAAMFTYRVEHHKQTNTSSLSSKTSPASSPASTTTKASAAPPQGTSPVITTNTTTAPSQKPNQNVITVSPIGVTITVPDSLKDLTYSATTASNGTITVSFSTTSLTQAAPSCSATSAQGAFETIIRGRGQYSGPAHPSSGALITQQPTFYVAYELPTGPCGENLSPNTQNLLDQQAQDFYSSLSTIALSS